MTVPIDQLLTKKLQWLVTGCAGFIGSHLVEFLLNHGQQVVGLDNFSTGKRDNLNLIQSALSEDSWKNFSFFEGDIRDFELCLKCCKGIDVVLHQAALGSVPRSIEDPLTTNEVNVNGFLNILRASQQSGVRRIVFASSSSVYGDDPNLPKREDRIGRQLSPYAISKYINELYAQNFSELYDLQAIGLRYFNVFGPRQDPGGPYAAVIPIWCKTLREGNPVTIFGDGTTSRDFCYIDNVVQANIRAALTTAKDAVNQVYNIAVGEQTSLNELFHLLHSNIKAHSITLPENLLKYGPFRSGDIQHSLADISKAKANFDYLPTININEGLKRTVNWYVSENAVATEL